MWFLGSSLLEGFELVSGFVLWLGDCFVLSCWIGDGVVEVMVFEWVASWSEGVVSGVVGRVEELPVGGKGFVLGFELYRHEFNRTREIFLDLLVQCKRKFSPAGLAGVLHIYVLPFPISPSKPSSKN